MSHVLTFDTLKYANKLKAAGVEPKVAEAQAEIQSEILSETIANQLATKQDLFEMKTELNGNIEVLRGEIKQFKNEVIIKLGAAIVAATTVLGVLLTIFHH